MITPEVIAALEAIEANLRADNTPCDPHGVWMSLDDGTQVSLATLEEHPELQARCKTFQAILTLARQQQRSIFGVGPTAAPSP